MPSTFREYIDSQRGFETEEDLVELEQGEIEKFIVCTSGNITAARWARLCLGYELFRNHTTKVNLHGSYGSTKILDIQNAAGEYLYFLGITHINDIKYVVSVSSRKKFKSQGPRKP